MMPNKSLKPIGICWQESTSEAVSGWSNSRVCFLGKGQCLLPLPLLINRRKARGIKKNHAKTKGKLDEKT